MRSLEDMTRILRSHREAISGDFKAQVLGVFGSYARGAQKPGSDIDILVRFDEGATLFDLSGLSDYLEELLGIKVDVVSERALRTELRDRILAEVVAV